jgi:hypothetical protein
VEKWQSNRKMVKGERGRGKESERWLRGKGEGGREEGVVVEQASFPKNS